jgi:hypothetical protein
MATKIQIRRGLSTEWNSVNPLLSQGEMGLETDTNLFKFGDGTSLWNSLVYVNDTTGNSRFITSTTTLTAGKEHVYYDLFILNVFNISEYTNIYNIAGTIFTNNAMVSILDKMWIDDTLYVGGDLNIGI